MITEGAIEAIIGIKNDIASEMFRTINKINKLKEKNYLEYLMEMANIAPLVHDFLDNVKIFHENESIRNNNLKLLSAIKKMFNEVGDLSLLQENKHVN